MDRQLLGDIALAVLLVLPTAAIAGSNIPLRAPTVSLVSSPEAAKAAPAERSMADRSVSLIG